MESTTINPKKIILLSIAGLYLVASLVYIVANEYNDFKLRYIQQSFEEGRKATINDLIQHVESQDCQPVDVYNEKTKLQLVDVSCLQQQNTKPAGADNNK